MIRKVIAVVVLVLFTTLLLLVTGNFEHRCINIRDQPFHIRQALLKAWLQRHHRFVSAADDNIEFIGRWTATNDRSSRSTGYPGSRIRLAIYNSTSIFIAFREITGASEHGVLRLHPLQIESLGSFDSNQQRIPPPLILVANNGQVQLFKHNTRGILDLSQALSREKIYEVEVLLLGSASEHARIVHFNGVWLSEGGYVGERAQHASKVGQALLASGDSYSHEPLQSDGSITKKPKSFIEVVSTTETVLYTSKMVPQNDSSLIHCFIHNLEVYYLPNHQIISLPIPKNVCLDAKCYPKPTSNEEPQIPTIQTLYFRTGPMDTPLFRHPWSWSSKPTQPNILILDIGLSDFHIFLTTQHQNHPISQRTLEAFTTSFIAAYVNFVLTIRRTRWHQQTPTQDPVFAYTSAPSDLKILIMTPLLPSTFNPSISKIVFNALHRVVTHLQTIEGDKNTFLIDTSGWLDDSDFHTPPSSHHPPIPAPNTKGHAKIAHFLYPHICPHLVSDTESCPFDRVDRYAGNVYVPDEDMLGRVMAEQKIERVKALLFGSDSGGL